jgi:adenine-specific DNA-methyltransferase
MYRYIGNKTRLASWLVSRIAEHASQGATVVDLMCGTASVSDALRAQGYRVIASDIMTYAVHHARVRLLLAGAPPFAALGLDYQKILAHLNTLEPVDGLFVREYSPNGSPLEGCRPRMYLTGENAARLDAISEQIYDWHKNGCITELENSLLRHNLIMAVNRVANIAGTYGHYRSSWSNAALSALVLRPTEFVAASRIDHVVLQGPAEYLANEIEADVCYIDPPYMKRQYAANYHLIETVARGDLPEAVGVSGLRPWRDQYSVFCTRTRIQDAFRRIVTQMKCDTFLISYSSDGLLTESELIDLFAPMGEVAIEKKSFPRFRSNQSSLGPSVEEYLITLQKRPLELFEHAVDATLSRASHR